MRLIDANQLKEDILIDKTNDPDVVNYYINMLDGMETAYDVDKVLDTFNYLVPVQTAHGASVNKEDAINIIKCGGDIDKIVKGGRVMREKQYEVGEVVVLKDGRKGKVGGRLVNGTYLIQVGKGGQIISVQGFEILSVQEVE